MWYSFISSSFYALCTLHYPWQYSKNSPPAVVLSAFCMCLHAVIIMIDHHDLGLKSLGTSGAIFGKIHSTLMTANQSRGPRPAKRKRRLQCFDRTRDSCKRERSTSGPLVKITAIVQRQRAMLCYAILLRYLLLNRTLQQFKIYRLIGKPNRMKIIDQAFREILKLIKPRTWNEDMQPFPAVIARRMR